MSSKISNGGVRFFIALICVALATFCWGAVFAESETPNPHKEVSKETGVIMGVLSSPNGEALGEHPVSLEVFHNRQPVLKIPKKTDSAGNYQFKNIFRSPDFHYIVSSEYEGKTYSTEPASLGNKESPLLLNLNLGKGSLISKENAADKPDHDCAVCKKKGMPIDEYQALAILLSIGAVCYVVFFRKRKV